MRETIEMLDGRIYVTDDNWTTIHKADRAKPGWHHPVTDKQEADLVRFLAVAQSSAGPA